MNRTPGPQGLSCVNGHEIHDLPRVLATLPSTNFGCTVVGSQQQSNRNGVAYEE